MCNNNYSSDIRQAVLTLLVVFVSLCGNAKDTRSQFTKSATEYSFTATQDTTQATKKLKKNSFWSSVAKPFKWVMKNWTAYDPHYSIPSFYNWVVQLQNTTSMEWVRMWTPEGMDITMRSKMSNKVGPYLGYSFLFYGYTVDVNALKGTNNRNEFTLSINSNLVNIDLIRRRTGGDFTVSRLRGAFLDPITDDYNTYNFDKVAHADNEMGDMIRLSLTGLNINYFTNHRHYSNPAAFSNGAIQLRSVGSPIIGLGFIHQSINNQIGNLITDYALGESFGQMTEEQKQTFLDEINYGRQTKINSTEEYYRYMLDQYYNNKDTWREEYQTFLNNSTVQPIILGKPDASTGKLSNTGLLGYYANGIPSEITLNDFHLQLGYAYNLVFSRRLLLGMSFIASPAIKQVKYNNDNTYMAPDADGIANIINTYYANFGIQDAIYADEINVSKKYTGFGLNGFARLSLTYNNDRWRAGININASSYNFMNKDFTVSNNYGSAVVYVGWCFGRKKMYRDGQREHEAFITTALTKQQIAERQDTVPVSNLGHGNASLQQKGKTKYKNDLFNLDIYGCDLVKGPDGQYGSFTIEDGMVATGQDTENRLRPGTVLPMDEFGDIRIQAGHDNSFLPANWWKKRISPRQVPYNENVEMLHYALKGKLVFYVRSHLLGTDKPVKVEFDDFYINHGKDSKSFFQVASKDMESHSSFSIIGNKNINGRLCRIYIESKEYGNRHDMYINLLRNSGRSWMKDLADDRPLSRVSIPGTHDAGTASLQESVVNAAAHTQNFTIAEQLQDGVRAFDIRLKANMKFGHMFECRDSFTDTMKEISDFLQKNPTEFIVALIGSDEGGAWSDSMKVNYNNLISQYSDLFIQDFDATTQVKDVRGKILVLRRQEACPFGKLLKFSDNTTFQYDCFDVEDVYKEHKTYKKSKIVAEHLRRAYENSNPSKWFITFNSIAWDPRHHKPYYTAWGQAVNVRTPMNPAMSELFYEKRYTNLGIIFLDFYNDHGDKPQLLEAIINSNFRVGNVDDYIPAE